MHEVKEITDVYKARCMIVPLMRGAKDFGGEPWVLGLLKDCISPGFPGGLSGPPIPFVAESKSVVIWRTRGFMPFYFDKSDQAM